MRKGFGIAVVSLALLVLPMAGALRAQGLADLFAPQYIAALADPQATQGTGAETWGLWEQDPGPRGVALAQWDALMARGGLAPAGWRVDAGGWWLEEHGLIMEAPVFALPAGEYVVTGGRQMTARLTIGAPDAEGRQNWALSDGASLHDVTHLGCRAALFRPAAAPQSCRPTQARSEAFPLGPGDVMPAVQGCTKQDYQVLIVIGRRPAG